MCQSGFPRKPPAREGIAWKWLLNSSPTVLVWHRLPGRGAHQGHGAEGPVSRQVCHSSVVTRSCREDGGGVPASAGELRRLGGAGCASCGQPVWRSEESRGLCPDDYVLVIFSQMLLIFAPLHPWSLLHQEEGGHLGTSRCPTEASSLGLLWGGRLSPWGACVEGGRWLSPAAWGSQVSLELGNANLGAVQMLVAAAFHG